MAVVLLADLGGTRLGAGDKHTAMVCGKTGGVNEDGAFYGTTLRISDTASFHPDDFSEFYIFRIREISSFRGKSDWKVTKMG